MRNVITHTECFYYIFICGDVIILNVSIMYLYAVMKIFQMQIAENNYI